MVFALLLHDFGTLEIQSIHFANFDVLTSKGTTVAKEIYTAKTWLSAGILQQFLSQK